MCNICPNTIVRNVTIIAALDNLFLSNFNAIIDNIKSIINI